MSSGRVISRRAPVLADYLELTKPGITVFALLTTAGTASLAPGTVSALLWLPLLAGTALIVGAANTLNMYLERDVDCKMARTKTRPLPAQRMEPEPALVFGIVQTIVAVPILTLWVNPLTAFLGVLALVIYVGMYTPLKQRTTLSLLVGSIPGAMPVLMGWTAATGRIELPGLAVFGVLFLWQIPHFHAIALFRWKEYKRAGHKVAPVEHGKRATHHAILLYLAAQVQVSLLLFPLGLAGIGYLTVALLLGLAYFGYALWGVLSGAGPRWAKRLFFMSLIYLPVLFAALVIDGIH
jgi:protoheme IX farnesyltransferase